MATALSRLDEQERKEFWACLAMRYAKGLGSSSASKAVRHFGSAYDAVQNTQEWYTIGLGDKAKFLDNDEWRTLASIEWENCKDLDAHIILWNSKDYPIDLRNVQEAPPMLYAHGDLSLINKPCIGIVGSRSCTKAGVEIGEYIATALSLCGFTVASGMARGIDRVAHIGGMKHVGSSIGVLGSGIDMTYPEHNSDLFYDMRKNGLLLSEFPPASHPDPRNFPKRNRIISGISQGVVLIEAGRKSGTIITAYKANEQGRNVYAIPGAFGSAKYFGCQQIIRHGAKAIFDVEDILVDILPLIGAKAQDINALLKAHKLSSEVLFGYNSVLNPDKEEKKLAKKRFDHIDYTIEGNVPERFRDNVAKFKEYTRSEAQNDFSNLLIDIEEEKPAPKTSKKNTKKNTNPRFDLLNSLESREEEKSTSSSNTKEDFKILYAKESLEYKIIELISKEKMQAETIARKLDTEGQEVTICLVNLELYGHISRYEGAWYGSKE